MLHLPFCPACLPACPACPQVYPAVKMDATKLIELLKPIRCGPRLPGLRCMWPCWPARGAHAALAGTHCLPDFWCPALPCPAPATLLLQGQGPSGGLEDAGAHVLHRAGDADARQGAVRLRCAAGRMAACSSRSECRDAAPAALTLALLGWLTPVTPPPLYACSAMMATREEYASGKRRPAKPAASKGGAASESKPAGGEKKPAEAATKPKAVAIKEEGGRRTGDSGNKGPALPPGMGVARSSGRGEAAQPSGERRRDSRPADGPPPGAAGCRASTVAVYGAWCMVPPGCCHCDC